MSTRWLMCICVALSLEAGAAAHSDGAKKDSHLSTHHAAQASDGRRAADSATSRISRAKALQHHHRFREAEQLLSSVIESEPRNVEATLLRAQIRIHMQDADGAMQDCSTLLRLTDVLTSTVCVAQVRALKGDTERAFALVTSALDREQGTPAVRSWGAGVAAELAGRRGDSVSAERWYAVALELDPHGHYPKAAYADWQRNQNRMQD